MGAGGCWERVGEERFLSLIVSRLDLYRTVPIFICSPQRTCFSCHDWSSSKMTTKNPLNNFYLFICLCHFYSNFWILICILRKQEWSNNKHYYTAWYIERLLRLSHTDINLIKWLQAIKNHKWRLYTWSSSCYNCFMLLNLFKLCGAIKLSSCLCPHYTAVRNLCQFIC